MKYTLYTIGRCLTMCAASALLFSACAKDDDSNPVLNTQNLSMTLLKPAYPATVTLNLSASESVNLKVQEQPNYGYPAIVTYAVQVAVDPAFLLVSPTDTAPSVKHVTLPTTYNTASMNVDALELNNAIIRLYQAANNGEDPTGKDLKAYVRVRASVVRTTGTTCYSNAVALERVGVAYVASLPGSLYLSGSSVLGGKAAKPWAPVYGQEGNFYTLAYFGAGDTFQWGDSEETGAGTSRTTSYDDQAGMTVSAAEDGSFKVGTAGWYVLHMALAVDKAKNRLTSALTIHPGAAHIIGAAAGDAWTDGDPAWLMKAPATADGEWESPAFAGSGELRAYVKVPGIDWWRTEFTLFKGSLFWRTVNIPSNWAENVGSAYSVTAEPGKKLYVNFDQLTGEVR